MRLVSQYRKIYRQLVLEPRFLENGIETNFGITVCSFYSFQGNLLNPVIWWRGVWIDRFSHCSTRNSIFQSLISLFHVEELFLINRIFHFSIFAYRERYNCLGKLFTIKHFILLIVNFIFNILIACSILTRQKDKTKYREK